MSLTETCFCSRLYGTYTYIAKYLFNDKFSSEFCKHSSQIWFFDFPPLLKPVTCRSKQYVVCTLAWGVRQRGNNSKQNHNLFRFLFKMNRLNFGKINSMIIFLSEFLKMPLFVYVNVFLREDLIKGQLMNITNESIILLWKQWRRSSQNNLRTICRFIFPSLCKRL